MPKTSFVLIGAGSTVFTPGLMTDLASSPVFAGWTIHLVDLSAEAAETMARLGRRIAKERGADLNFVAHTDRREALAGASFVTTTIAVGAAAGWLHDVEVPARHGVAQTVGDSVGPGGVLRALRHVPELVAIGKVSAKRDLWDRLHGQADGVLPLDGIEKQEAERLVAIAAAITTGRDTVELAVNLPNQGKIPNLPPEAVVEVPAVAGAAGVTGLAVGPLPEAIAAALTARVQQQELTVRAALSGRRAQAIQALALDPLVPDPHTAAAILDDAIAAHGGAMDRFSVQGSAA